jgi:hypothetical protein
MDVTFGNRLKHAWNAFMNKDPTYSSSMGASYSYRPDRTRLTRGNERSIITSIYNRIGMDVASVAINHVRLDDNGRYLSAIPSSLNECLSVSANIDQTARAFIQDVVISMLDEGSVAIIPIETSFDPKISESYDILSMRTGKVVAWHPTFIKVRVYNDRTGLHEDIDVPKNVAAIIENPLYSVINEHNSTMQRLVSKLNLLDSIDQQSSSGKLDLIVQLPYVIKTPARKELAEQRRKDIEDQLTGSRYGIAYTDGTEKVIQLNRPVENNLMGQIQFLTSMLYSQLGITQSILDGTADDRTMNNYFTRSIEPFLSAIVDEMKRKFLTKTARSQKQSIVFIRDPFKLVPISQLSDVADKFTRNEILSPNEVRGIVGYKPSNDPKADELRNRNLNPNVNPVPNSKQDGKNEKEKGDIQNDKEEV